MRVLGPAVANIKSAGLVALGDGIVLDIGVLPSLVHGGIAAETELDDEAGNDAEESGVVVETMLHQIVEAVGAERSPGARDLNDDVALGGGEFYFVHVGSFGGKRCGLLKSRIGSHSVVVLVVVLRALCAGLGAAGLGAASWFALQRQRVMPQCNAKKQSRAIRFMSFPPFYAR